MEAPALANFYDLTQDDAPLAQLPEVINLASCQYLNRMDWNLGVV